MSNHVILVLNNNRPHKQEVFGGKPHKILLVYACKLFIKMCCMCVYIWFDHIYTNHNYNNSRRKIIFILRALQFQEIKNHEFQFIYMFYSRKGW